MVILATRSSSVSTTVSYTSCFMCPYRKKSRHVRSGDLGGQTTGSLRLIHRFPKVTLRWCRHPNVWYCGTRRLGKRCRYSLTAARPFPFTDPYTRCISASHFSMLKPLHVHCCCHKAVMISTESVWFQVDLWVVLSACTHSQLATPTQQLTSAPLTKCSLTLQVDFRDHNYVPFRNIFVMMFSSSCINLNE